MERSLLIQRVRDHLLASARTLEVFSGRGEAVVEAAVLMATSIQAGGKIMFCGNGGSAADSQHVATEFVVRLRASFEREALPAVALTTDTSLITACANDFSYDRIFSRQVAALGRAGDVVVGISTSGNSENVVRALQMARDRGMKTVLFSGRSGGRLLALADVAVLVPADDTSHIQEGQLCSYHALCLLVEELVCGPPPSNG